MFATPVDISEWLFMKKTHKSMLLGDISQDFLRTSQSRDNPINSHSTNILRFKVLTIVSML